MEFAQLAFILSWSVPLILLISVFIGLFLIKTLSPLFKLLLLYLVIALLFDMVSRLIGLVLMKNNLILIPVYGLIELTLMSFIYYKVFIRKMKYLILFFWGIGLAFSIYEIFTVQYNLVMAFQSYSRVAVAFIVVLYAMIFFFEKLSAGSDPKDYKLSINTGILIYYSLSVVILLPINFLINEGSALKFYFLLGYSFITILFYLFLTYAIWKNGKTLKRLRSGLE